MNPIPENKLTYTQKNAWVQASAEEIKNAFEFCDDYKDFMNRAKTEREFVEETENLVRSHGFISIAEIIRSNQKIAPGMKIYQINRKKSVILTVIGSNPLEDGVNIVGAHIDAPRIDIKQNPLYEQQELSFLKTHYYGGIKKYQWVTIPLALHGVIVRSDGSVVKVNIGEDAADPVFTITDLLPHLADDQMEKKLKDGITGEGLNILIGSIPFQKGNSISNGTGLQEKVKLNILQLLHDKYGIIEEDFVSAELEAVPAIKACDVGLDRGLVGAYGQDDRVCSYTALKALLDLSSVERTAICILTDKEEIGSEGNTGAKSSFFLNFLDTLITYSSNASSTTHKDLRRIYCLRHSKMLSADVGAAIDPNFIEVHEKRNSSYVGSGISIFKFTGHSGKVGASDAHAEFVGDVRKLFNDNNIIWHAAEFGKVDQGGGGTIAKYIANLGVDVIDCGTPVLSMHSPFELTSKMDVYTTYKACNVFYKFMK